nr:MAG TPA: hypothetical protein [Caudoviricetes sp.]
MQQTLTLYDNNGILWLLNPMNHCRSPFLRACVQCLLPVSNFTP